MIISTEKPACWDRLEKRFGIKWESGVIVTYAGVVHTISGKLSPDLVIHEQVHLDQQAGMDPESWLEKYLNDLDFRFESEFEAYKAQADFLRQTEQYPSILENKIRWIWQCMASHYGGMISYEKAKQII